MFPFELRNHSTTSTKNSDEALPYLDLGLLEDKQMILCSLESSHSHQFQLHTYPRYDVMENKLYNKHCSFRKYFSRDLLISLNDETKVLKKSLCKKNVYFYRWTLILLCNA